MKNTRLALTMTALASLLTPALLANEWQTNSASKLIRLHSNGETVGEVRLVKGAELTLRGENTERDLATGRTTATDATVEIRTPGGRPVTIKADRIEVIDNDAVKVMAMKGAVRKEPEPKLESHEVRNLDVLRDSLRRALAQYPEEPPMKRVRERVASDEIKKAE